MTTILVDHYQKILFKVFDANKGPQDTDIYSTYNNMLEKYPYFENYEFLDVYIGKQLKYSETRVWEFLAS